MRATLEIRSSGEMNSWTIKSIAAKNVAKLPEAYRRMTGAPTYPVKLSQNLSNLMEQLEQKIKETEILDTPS